MLSADEYSELFEHHIDEAKKELDEKSLLDIQLETALKWCGRACAAAEKGLEHDATEYAHEAVEHAALAGDDRLLNAIRHALEFHKVEL